MIPEFNSNKDSGQMFSEDSQVSREIDILQRDRFELVSAYLDGEVSAAERKQVQEWLETSPEVQRQYARLVKLRQVIQTIPVPACEQSAQQTAEKVFKTIDRRRYIRGVAFGGSAIAALFIGALSTVFAGNQSPIPQIAQSVAPEVQPAPLMVALNRPVIEIPKAPVAVNENSIKPLIESNGNKHQ